MPARQPIFSAQSFYHIYNRGHNKESIFLHYKDYSRYLKRLEEFLTKHNITLLAYCLMPNHIHLLLRQNGDESPVKFVHRLPPLTLCILTKNMNGWALYFKADLKRSSLIQRSIFFMYPGISLNPLEIVRAQGPALNSLLAYPWSSLKEYADASLPHFGS